MEGSRLLWHLVHSQCVLINNIYEFLLKMYTIKCWDFTLHSGHFQTLFEEPFWPDIIGEGIQCKFNVVVRFYFWVMGNGHSNVLKLSLLQKRRNVEVVIGWGHGQKSKYNICETLAIFCNEGEETYNISDALAIFRGEEMYMSYTLAMLCISPLRWGITMVKGMFISSPRW